MNQSLQSHTPTAHPLNYDSLASREGCGDESGHEFYGVLAFFRLCISAGSGYFKFDQPDTVSYQVGPDSRNSPGSQVLNWSAWCSTVGIRLGIVSTITPPAPTTGQLSDFFPTGSYPKVTHCFDSQGLLHVAVQKPENVIELKWNSDTSTIEDLSFTGVSPMLFSASNMDPSGAPGVVCYYLKTSRPKALYARFSQDEFATERLVMPSMRAGLARLISISAIGDQVYLYARDDQGRDVTLSSPHYAQSFTQSSSSVLGIISGSMLGVYSETEDYSDQAGSSVLIISGRMTEATAETEDIETGKSSNSIAIVSGRMIKP